MLVVLSDLHFEEERSDHIPGSENDPPITYSRNLPGKAFRRFIAHLAAEAVRNKAQKLDLILAGDIFDINRTSLWFTGDNKSLRPYVPLEDVGSDLQDRILAILKAIKAEESVSESLHAFGLLANGRYEDDGTKRFPVPTELHLIPGNHDRMLNATPAIREIARSALSVKGGSDPFPHFYSSTEESVLVRHGHEYDRFNFSVDLNSESKAAFTIPEEAYSASPFGDFATIDLASRVPTLFRAHHGDGAIIADPLLRRIYLRLLEFDDLRPQRAILNFLLHIPNKSINQRIVWEAIEPVVLRLIEEVHEDPFLNKWLQRMDKKWRIDAIDFVQTAFRLKSWQLTGLPLRMAQLTSNSVLPNENLLNNIPRLASKEAMIQQGEFRFLIAGHTHSPRIELIANDEKGERYYIDTGTWRNRVTATHDFRAFSRLKSMTYVIVYGPDEDRGEGAGQKKLASFDFWSGATQRWFF